MTGKQTAERTVLRVTGAEREDFLQNLVTNDVGKLSAGIVYAALLTPQGKYLADFFLVPQADAILIDVKSDIAPGLLQRLSMYKLRASVEIVPTDIAVSRGTGEPPAGAFADSRHTALGWRAYGQEGEPDGTDWDRLRVDHTIPETGIELVPGETFILEAGFERLSGVDFHKGCYVGQEVTARMRHKTELRKGLVAVEVDGEAPIGTEILAHDRPAGRLYTQSAGRGIAFLRFDRAADEMRAGDAVVRFRA